MARRLAQEFVEFAWSGVPNFQASYKKYQRVKEIQRAKKAAEAEAEEKKRLKELEELEKRRKKTENLRRNVMCSIAIGAITVGAIAVIRSKSR